MKKIGIIIIIGMLITIAVLSGCITTLGIYGTDISNMRTSTERWRERGYIGNREGTDPHSKGSPVELIDQVVYVTSFQKNARSQKIVVRGCIKQWLGIIDIAWDPEFYWYVVYYSKDDSWSKDEVIFNGFGNHYDPTLIEPITPIPWKEEGDKTDDTFWCKPLEFYIKGSKVGAIRVDLMFQFRQFASYTRYKMSSDKAYLASGAGTIKVDSDTDLFEISEDVPIKITTGFSGQTTGDQGYWVVKLKDPNGKRTILWDKLEDDTDYNKKWKVTNNAWRSDWSNIWTFELWNTLFPQDYVDIATCKVKADVPQRPEITVDNPNPEMGDTIKITFSVEKTTYDVSKFYWCAYYGSGDPSSFTEFIRDWNYINAVNGKATVSIKPQKAGVTTIKARTYDTQNNPSESNKYSFSTHEGNYKLTVNVIDNNGDPLKGADVHCSKSVHTTDVNGLAVFYLKKGSYTLTAEKENYETKSMAITIDSDKSITIILKYYGDDFSLNIIVAIVVFIIFMIVAFLPQIPIPGGLIGRIIVAIIGAVLSIIAYLYL